MPRREHMVTLVAAAILVAATVGAVLTSHAEDWHPLAVLGLLTVLALGSETLSFEIRGLRLSGSFLAIVLAMALLGPAPAVALACACTLFESALNPRPLNRLLFNLATAAAYALAGGLMIEGLAPLGHVGPAVVRRRRAGGVPGVEHAELRADRRRRALPLRRAGARAAGVLRHRAAVRVRHRPADRRRRLHLRPPRRGLDRPRRGRPAGLPVHPAHQRPGRGAWGGARAAHPRARLAAGRPALDRPADALDARRDDRPPFRRRRALLARSGRRSSASTSASRT